MHKIFLMIINKRFCTNKCPNYRNNINHLHPIGAFRNVYKDLILKKKNSQNIGILNWEVPNTFTEVDFYDSNLIVSTETNNDDLKFWELRNMLTNEFAVTIATDMEGLHLKQQNIRSYRSMRAQNTARTFE